MNNKPERSNSWIAEENRRIAAIRREEMRRADAIETPVLPGVQLIGVHEDSNLQQARNMTDQVGPEPFRAFTGNLRDLILGE